MVLSEAVFVLGGPPSLLVNEPPAVEEPEENPGLDAGGPVGRGLLDRFFAFGSSHQACGFGARKPSSSVIVRGVSPNGSAQWSSDPRWKTCR